MNESLKKFLTAPAAEKVKVDSAVIIHRTKLSPADIIRIKEKKEYTIPDYEKVCELEVSGQIVAKGSIVRRKGGFYFKVGNVLVQE